MGRLTNVIRIRASPWPNRPAPEICSWRVLARTLAPPSTSARKVSHRALKWLVTLGVVTISGQIGFPVYENTTGAYDVLRNPRDP